MIKIKRKYAVYFVFMFFLPLISCVAIVLAHLHEAAERQKIALETIQMQSVNFLIQTLRKTETDMKIVLASSELIDYLYADGSIRIHLENRLVGRVESIAFDEVDCWQFFDQKQVEILRIAQGSCAREVEEIDGFSLSKSGSFVIINKPVIVDDNNFIKQDGGAIGSISAHISVERILSKDDVIARIIRIPSDLKENDFKVELRPLGELQDSSWIEIASAVVATILFSMIGCFWVYRDQKRDSLVQALGQAAQMIAHDIRKPFSQLKGLMQILSSQENIVNKQMIERLLPHVELSMRKVDAMLEELLYSGVRNVNRSFDSDLVQVIKEVFSDLSHGNKNITLTIDLQHRSRVDMDPMVLMRIVGNIIFNALEMMDSGEIWIVSREVGFNSMSRIQCYVGNTNTHIPKRNLKRIFEPFFSEKRHGGTGLGLAIVKHLVEAGGGKIACTSSPEKGVEFSFTLPYKVGKVDDFYFDGSLLDFYKRCAGDTATSSSSANVSVSGRTYTVLVIDDEVLYIEALHNQIRQSKFAAWVSFYSASDAESAKNMALSLRPDLVIVDIDLGSNIDGFDVVKILKELSVNSIFCIHSNRTKSSYEEVLSSGAIGFVPKPMTIPQFEECLALVR